MKIDFEMEPPFFKVSDTHYAATWLLHPRSARSKTTSSVTLKNVFFRMKAGEQHD